LNGELSAIKYKLSSLLEMNNKVIKIAIIMIDDSCRQVIPMSHNLVYPSLKKFSLVEAAEVYCGNLNDINTDVEFTFQHLGDALDISKKVEVTVFRIVQELITNSIKHADATAINLQISCRNNTIQVSIEDDGKGFDRDAVKSEGIGLSNVQSRIDYLKASVDFISNDKGTSYAIDIDKKELNDN
jgi:two-component system NarL family sensor kinase